MMNTMNPMNPMSPLNGRYETAPATVCSACGGLCEAHHITLTLRRAANTFVLVRNVPADVCQDCGDSQFTLPVASQLISALRMDHAPADVAFVPIYDFPAA